MDTTIPEKIKNELSKKRFKGLSRNFLGDQSGAAMFLFNYSRCFNDSISYKNACKCIENVINYYSNHFDDIPSLSKFEWMIKYLADNSFFEIEPYDKSDLEILEKYLFNAQNICFENGNFDFLYGGLGIGLYFVNRKKEKEVVKLVDDIEKLSENDKSGIKWKANTFIEKWDKTYNLSLSHGISSIMVMLCKIYNSGIETIKTRRLLEGGVNYMLAQKLPSGQYNSIFGNLALESSYTLFPSRLAWCYGDLCVATSVWQAAKTLKNEYWANEAKTILIHSSQRRDLAENGVVDACFCHGTAGIGHVFNRMYHETNLKECKDAAKYWFEKTIEMSIFDDGPAGYKVWQGLGNGYESETGLLEGIAGIGLALLSYYHGADLSWDECLLLS